MSDLSKGRNLWSQRNNQTGDDTEPDPDVTGTERGRQLWQRRKTRSTFEAPEAIGADVTPGGDAA